jgi:hypothetical protein
MLIAVRRDNLNPTIDVHVPRRVAVNGCAAISNTSDEINGEILQATADDFTPFVMSLSSQDRSRLSRFCSTAPYSLEKIIKANKPHYAARCCI